MIVLDTGFLVAYHNSRDVHHPAATSIMANIIAGKWGQALLLEYVFMELLTVLLVRRDLAAASSAATALLPAREVDFLPCSDTFLDTLEYFRSQRSTELSFVDAAIATVARRPDSGIVATFDREFEKLPGITVVS